MTDKEYSFSREEASNPNNEWMNRKWRPMMAWSYMITCITDFVIFPVLWALHSSMMTGKVAEQWQPLTLEGAGLYHIAMGAILGVAAYGRTKEKVEQSKVTQKKLNTEENSDI